MQPFFCNPLRSRPFHSFNNTHGRQNRKGEAGKKIVLWANSAAFPYLDSTFRYFWDSMMTFSLTNVTRDQILPGNDMYWQKEKTLGWSMAHTLYTQTQKTADSQEGRTDRNKLSIGFINTYSIMHVQSQTRVLIKTATLLIRWDLARYILHQQLDKESSSVHSGAKRAARET